MQCLNLKNKEVKAAFDEVAKVLNSEDAAYYVISKIMVMLQTRILMDLSLSYSKTYYRNIMEIEIRL